MQRIDSAVVSRINRPAATILTIRFHERPAHVATAKRPPRLIRTPMRDTLRPSIQSLYAQPFERAKTGLSVAFDLPHKGLGYDAT